MDYTTVYVGMDTHKNSFTLRSFVIGMDEPENTIKTDPDYRQVLIYLESLRHIYGEDTRFVCGYEAGCLGYSLYRQLTSHGVTCVILAPSTMSQPAGRKKVKNDRRDAGNIAQCLAFRTYSPVHVPTEQDEQVKEYIRMRDDHKEQLRAVKQQILAFCLRHSLRYSGGKSYWTAAHLKWLHTLELEPLCQEILMEYLATYGSLADKVDRLDRRIGELAALDAYHGREKKLECFTGIRTHTALAALVEVGDFSRFATADRFASYLGLVPGEDSSGDRQKRLGITKAGNSHLRKLLVEAAQCYGRGTPGQKPKALKARQYGNPADVVAYADRANERLKRKYRRMVLQGKSANVAKTAIARELACFMWGMMTGQTV